MIQDNQTNVLNLADILPLKYPTFYDRLENTLKECQVDYRLLPNTKDVWAVDYMPVQVRDNRFVQFDYNPDYLKPAKWHKTITDVDRVCNAIGINPDKSNIILDGGNVCKSRQAVIMCDKVFRENPAFSEKQLIDALKSAFEVDKIFFVPQDKSDFTGHADGMARFLNENTVLINDYSGESPEFQSAFRMSIHNAGLNYIEIPYSPDLKTKDSAKGLYLNYLEMDKLMLLPVFGIEEDEAAVKRFEDLFAGYTIRTVESNEIAIQGGVLNCISWNIKV